MSFQSLFFSMEGRIGRGGYWIGLIAISVVGFVAGLILWRIFGAGLILTGGGRFAQFVVVMALLYPGYCVMAKRFQDRNESRSLALAGIGVMAVKAVLDLFHVTGDPWVPNALDTVFLVIQIGIGLWYFVALGCLRGTVGDNHYGHDPVPVRA
jgi:uncharacterized membrane protein YhaH (DUF805 family)